MMKNKFPSLLQQIQRIIALEAVSTKIIEMYLDKSLQYTRILAYYTTIPNHNCIDVPEKAEKELIYSNKTIQSLSKHITRQLTYNNNTPYFSINNHFNLN